MGAKKVSTSTANETPGVAKKPMSADASGSNSNAASKKELSKPPQKKKAAPVKSDRSKASKSAKNKATEKRSSSSKISNELKNLGIDILQDGPKGFGLKQTTASSTDCKTSICESVKVKSRSSSSPANYVPFKVNKIKSSSGGKKGDAIDDKSTDKGDNQIKGGMPKTDVAMTGAKSGVKKDKTDPKNAEEVREAGDEKKGATKVETTKKVKLPLGSPKKGDSKKKETEEESENNEASKELKTVAKKPKIFKKTPTLPVANASQVKHKVVSKKASPSGFIKPKSKIIAMLAANASSEAEKAKDVYDFHESGSGSEPLSPIPVQETSVKKAPIYKRKNKPKDLDESKTEDEEGQKETLKSSENESAEEFKTPLSKLKSKVSSKSGDDSRKKKPAAKPSSKSDSEGKRDEEKPSEAEAEEEEDDVKPNVSKKPPAKSLSDSDEPKSKAKAGSKKQETSEDEKKTPVKKVAKKAAKPAKKPAQVKPKAATKVSTEESEDDSDASDDSVVTRIQQRRAAKTRHMKKYGFWGGPKRHREASLNALAKVHCMYENESRSTLEQNLIQAAKLESLKDMDKAQKAAKKSEDESAEDSEEDDEEEKEEDTKRTLRTAPGLRGAGKHWEMDESNLSSDQEFLKAAKSKKVKVKEEREAQQKKKKAAKPKASPKPSPNKAKKVVKPKPKKPPAKPQKDTDSERDETSESESEERKKIDPKKRKRNNSSSSMEFKNVLTKKRMASLNATAMLAATYEVERVIDKQLSERIPVEEIKREKEVKVKEEKGKEKIKEEKTESPQRAQNVKQENSDEPSRPVSTSVVIVQDTDVTITGVYVNSSQGTNQESYCKMQYRVQSSVTEQRVERPVTQDPPKSYTPLTALNSMRPPGLAEGHSMHYGQPPQCESPYETRHPYPPPPPPPSTSSAFCAPPHHLDPQSGKSFTSTSKAPIPSEKRRKYRINILLCHSFDPTVIYYSASLPRLSL